MSKILIIGGGGREHALAWKLSHSPQVKEIFVAPGNGGTTTIATNVPIKPTEVNKLLTFAKKNNIDLTIVGQDDSLAAGVVDMFHKEGLKIFGPSKAAAQIEASKAFSKDLMKDNNIPTAHFAHFTDIKLARKYIKTCTFPTVIKASGLAAGKGVIICQNQQEAKNALEEIMSEKIFGDSGNVVVVEDFLRGQEISIHALSDGNNAAIFPASQDHKQIFDDDKGPNTGGMGVIAPVDWVNNEMLKKINSSVVQPALEGLKNFDTPFIGCLYPGLMINEKTIKTLEFNARFGDPETQVYMSLLDCDIFDILKSCVDGDLEPKNVKWKKEYAVTVTLASGGYPGKYKTGLLISGIEDAEKIENVVVFHAGTKKEDDSYFTSGGRVLNITATGSTLKEALEIAYKAINKIHFDGMHYRKDIGKRPQP